MELPTGQRYSMRSDRTDRHRRGTTAAVGAVAALVVAQLLWGAPAAQAHDVLVSTNPADKSTVATVPTQVVLTFDQVAFGVGSQVLVNGPGGNIAVGPVHIVDHNVTEVVASGSPAGSYTVLWRVTSADGHPVSGSFTFTATAASSRTASGPDSTATQPSRAAGSTTHSRTLWWTGGIVVVVAVWIGGVALVRRRRPSGEGRTAPPHGR